MRSDLLVDEYSTYYAALEKADYDFQHIKRKLQTVLDIARL